MRSRQLILTLAVLALACGVVLTVRANQQREQPDLAVLNAQRAAFRSGGFRAAAAVTGSYVETFSYGDGSGPANLEELARGSKLIVVGQTRSNHSVLNPRGDQIRTQYSVHVEELLKGDLPAQDHGDRNIVISVLGGRVSFPDGTWAQVNIRGFEIPLNDRRYVLFLIPVPDEAKQGPQAVEVPETQFWPIAGAQGIFRIEPNGAVRASARSLNSKSPSKDFDKKGSSEFLQELRRVLKKES